MNRQIKLVPLALALLTFAAFASTGCGSDSEGDALTSQAVISDPWARVTTPQQKTGAVYMTITMTGTAGDELQKVEVPASVADHAELHTVVMADDESEADDESGESKMHGSEKMHDSEMPAPKSDDKQMDGSPKGGMTMKQVHSIEIHGGDAVILEPGGYHVMLIGLKKPIAKGDRVELTLTFKRSGRKQVVAVARD